jgi:hypothetical protein
MTPEPLGASTMRWRSAPIEPAGDRVTWLQRRQVVSAVAVAYTMTGDGGRASGAASV